MSCLCEMHFPSCIQSNCSNQRLSSVRAFATFQILQKPESFPRPRNVCLWKSLTLISVAIKQFARWTPLDVCVNHVDSLLLRSYQMVVLFGRNISSTLAAKHMLRWLENIILGVIWHTFSLYFPFWSTCSTNIFPFCIDCGVTVSLTLSATLFCYCLWLPVVLCWLCPFVQTEL